MKWILYGEKHIMNRYAGMAAVGLAALLSAASAASAAVTISGTVRAVDADNNFRTQLGAAFDGASNLVFLDFASFTLLETSRLTFTEVAAESGYNNAFTISGLGTMTETGNFAAANFLAPPSSFESRSGVFQTMPSFSFSNGISANNNGAPGTSPLGVFLARDTLTTGTGAIGAVSTFTTSLFFLAYDDQSTANTPNGDDNHDDYIVSARVAPVPLPATALLLLPVLAGFAVAGRRARRAAA